MKSSMKKARFVAVAAVLVAAVVVGLAPVVAADPADYPVTLFPSGAASPFSITRGPDGALWFTFSNATEFGNAIGRIDTAGNVTRFELPNPGNSFNLGLGFNNAYGQRILTAHSQFEPNRPAGERVGPQVFVCDIPSLTLMPGEYALRLWLDIGNTEADLINDATRLSMLESDYYGTGKVPWNGTFVLKQHWYLEQAADAK